MASILAQYKVYIHPHKPFLFSCRLLLSFVSWLFLVYSLREIYCQAHMVVQCTLFIRRVALTELLVSYVFLGASLKRQLQNLMHSYLHTIIQHQQYIEKLSLLIKIKLKDWETHIDHVPACISFVRKKGYSHCLRHPHRKRQIYKALTLLDKQLLLKRD